VEVLEEDKCRLIMWPASLPAAGVASDAVASCCVALCECEATAGLGLDGLLDQC
jgi:hypothetical protein